MIDYAFHPAVGRTQAELQSSETLIAEADLGVPDAFQVRDHASAAWLVRKVVEARAHAERVRSWAAGELRRAEHDERWLLDRFGSQLELWLRAELDRLGGRRRSVALPDGAVGLRRTPERLHVADEPRLARWCAANLPAALRVAVEADGPAAVALARWQGEHAEASRQRQKVLREPLGRHVAETGELPDGATLLPAGETFYLK